MQKRCVYILSGILPVLGVILCLLSSCKKSKETDKPVPDTIAVIDTPDFACAPATFGGIATTYNDLFTRGDAVTEQWTGADATYSVPLGDGYILWAFGDTFLGKVNSPDAKHTYRWRPPSGLISNTFMVQNTNVTPNKFVTVVGPGREPVTEGYWPVAKTGNEYKTGTAKEWYWPCDGTVKGDDLYILFAKFKVLPNGSSSTVGTDLFTFSVAALKGLTATISTISSTSSSYYSMPLSQFGETHFGAAVMEEGNKDLYIYIADKIDFYPYGHWHCSKAMKVGQDNINGTRSYLAGYGPAPGYTPQWINTFPGSAANSGNMQRIENGKLRDLLVMNQFSVIKTKYKYRLIMQSEGENDSRNIYSYESSSPVGPWDCKTLIHTISDPDLLPVNTYNGSLHPEIKNGDNQILFSYNINVKNFGDLFSNVDTYRPKFIWITIPD